LSSTLPGASAISLWSPRSWMASSLVFVTSSRKRVQRAQRMQRSWSSMTSGPIGIAFFLRTFSGSGKRLRCRS
jgi:hypothetical protein